MKVGLVLGAGGVLGGAWLTGGLAAVADETGWDPAEADYVLGTSAGSMIGSILACGVPPWFMVAHSSGESFEGVSDARGRPATEADRSGGASFRPHRGLPSPLPGSLALAARSLLRPTRHTPTQVIAGWIPKGAVSTEPLSREIDHVTTDEWAPHPGLWVVACDYATGRRIPFGREHSPPALLRDAVAASCAIPGFYRPVRIGGREYVDGGVYSTSNLDLLRGLGLDLVICLNPTSSMHPPRLLNPAVWPGALLRQASGRRLGNEAAKLRAGGTEVVLIQPRVEDLRAMGPNLMSRRRRNEVIATARRTVRRQLRVPTVRRALSELPPGPPEKVSRPPEDPAEWPDLLELARRIGEERRARVAGD